MRWFEVIADAFEVSRAEAKRLIRQGAVTVWECPPGHIWVEPQVAEECGLDPRKCWVVPRSVMEQVESLGNA